MRVVGAWGGLRAADPRRRLSNSADGIRELRRVATLCKRNDGRFQGFSRDYQQRQGCEQNSCIMQPVVGYGFGFAREPRILSSLSSSSAIARRRWRGCSGDVDALCAFHVAASLTAGGRPGVSVGKVLAGRAPSSSKGRGYVTGPAVPSCDTWIPRFHSLGRRRVSSQNQV